MGAGRQDSRRIILVPGIQSICAAPRSERTDRPVVDEPAKGPISLGSVSPNYSRAASQRNRVGPVITVGHFVLINLVGAGAAIATAGFGAVGSDVAIAYCIMPEHPASPSVGIDAGPVSLGVGKTAILNIHG